MTIQARVPIIGFVAFSGTGKTTLLVKLLGLLRQHELRVGIIKHAHHSFELDHPGKDSYELRHAGASQMLIGSRQRWALICETPNAGESELQEYADRLDQTQLDLILVEGFKRDTFPKIELHRPSLGHPLLASDDPGIIAIAHDAPTRLDIDRQQLDINDPAVVADFIIESFMS